MRPSLRRLLDWKPTGYLFVLGSFLAGFLLSLILPHLDSGTSLVLQVLLVGILSTMASTLSAFLERDAVRWDFWRALGFTFFVGAMSGMLSEPSSSWVESTHSIHSQLYSLLLFLLCLPGWWIGRRLCFWILASETDGDSLDPGEMEGDRRSRGGRVHDGDPHRG